MCNSTVLKTKFNNLPLCSLVYCTVKALSMLCELPALKSAMCDLICSVCFDHNNIQDCVGSQESGDFIACFKSPKR